MIGVEIGAEIAESRGMKFAPLFAFLMFVSHFGHAAPPAPAVKQAPPAGVKIPDADRAELEAGVASLRKDIDQLARDLAAQSPLRERLPEVEVFHKAVRDALVYDEFMDVKQVAQARALLKEGAARVKSLREGAAPWTRANGQVTLGYRSKIDGSVQPYGLVVPPNWKPDDKTRRPLYLWFHGRDDKLTELSFISGLARSAGEFAGDNHFVLHLYGRYCNASKFAGEVDAFEAMQEVIKNYPIDFNRMVAMGFSMGGATVWHLATHHAGLWAAASPGAGFAETAVYAKVFAEGKEPPPWWEQVLWHWYDATDYASNLSNTQLVAYSGEIDPQKASADTMEKAMAGEGLKLERLVGPNTAHKYEPETKKVLTQRMADLALQGRDPFPKKVHFTTYTLSYNRMKWIEVTALERHWERADIDAEVNGDRIAIKTRNIAAFSLARPSEPSPLADVRTVVVDGKALQAEWKAGGVQFAKTNGTWAAGGLPAGELVKKNGLNGPIDHAFTNSFIFVKPSGAPLNSTVGGWAKSELERATVEWRRVFRGEARVKADKEISDEDIATSNLILWGDPSSNAVLAKILPKLPIKWTAQAVVFGKKSYPADSHAPVLIFPNPLNPNRYVVLNSGFTFREGATVSNSLQTPKLPDWAIVDLRVPADDRRPGGIVNAGFFDERWAVPTNE